MGFGVGKMAPNGPNLGPGVHLGYFEGWKPQKPRGLYLVKIPSELVFEPRCPRYGQITVLAHMNRAESGFGRAKRLKMAHDTPCFGSPIVQGLLSSKTFHWHVICH